MYCLIQLYISVSKPLAPHQPLLKLFSIKAVGQASIPLYRSVPLKPLTSVLDVLAREFSFIIEYLWCCQECTSLISNPDIRLILVAKTKYMTADDIDIGIGALLETFEMM